MKTNFDYYSLVIFPDINNQAVRQFRNNFDPLVTVIDPHITLIFPVKVPIEISANDLSIHIRSIAAGIKPFSIKIEGLTMLWDNWLCLGIKEGNKKIIDLHDKLYSGKLKLYWRHDIEYVPHVAVGSFSKKGYDLTDPKKLEQDKAKLELAKKEVNNIDIGYSHEVKELTLVKLDSKLKGCKIIKKFLIAS